MNENEKATLLEQKKRRLGKVVSDIEVMERVKSMGSKLEPMEQQSLNSLEDEKFHLENYIHKLENGQIN
jgi:hypothetical protein